MDRPEENRAAGVERSEEAEIAQLVREGVHPKDLKGWIKVTLGTFLGNVPLGLEQRNKTVRKILACLWQLLDVLALGFWGGLSTLVGLGILYFSLIDAIYVQGIALGAAFLVMGIWVLRYGYKAYRIMRAISKA
jgi:hypothetical protein